MNARDRFDVHGRIVLITGGGQGIGRAIALAFADAGANLVIASRTANAIEETAMAARECGVTAISSTVDVTSVASVDHLIDRAVAAFGRIDVLVNSAGVFINHPALDMSEDDWNLMADTNLKGLFFCARGAARVMRAQGAGTIINISSALATVAQQGYACYGATKAGVEHLTRVLAREWAPFYITVNAIAPTTTITEVNAERLQTQEAQAQARQKIPLGRYGESADLIGAALFLASPAATFITGQTLRVDGGLSLT